MPYLKTCVESVLVQDYESVEVIISCDHCTDGSAEFVRSLHDPKVRLIEPSVRLSMSEHWDWALSHASGEWQIFVGQDDALQSYFFMLADNLTDDASKKGVKIVCSRRAYYFWPGCEDVYKSRVSFYASKNARVISLQGALLKCSLFQGYHDFPQMYTCSLFHESLLDEARMLQHGRVLTCHPQDANLAVIAASFEKAYLYSGIPLGWVGSSPKSAGLAISSGVANSADRIQEATKNLREEYDSLVSKSVHSYNQLAGDFKYADLQVYYWQAVTETPQLRSNWQQRFFSGKAFRYVLFGASYARLIKKGSNNRKFQMFIEMLDINQLSFVFTRSLGQFFFVMFLIWYVISLLFIRLPRRMFRFFFQGTIIRFSAEASESDIGLRESNLLVGKIVKEKLL